MKVVLIGDSIRMGYQPLVAEKLAGQAEVWGPPTNGRHSLWVLDHFQEWVADQKPDVFHLNCGIHDAVIMDDGRAQIILDQYRLCLERIIRKVQAVGTVRMIWATTTPRYKPTEGAPMGDWPQMLEIDTYNAVALEVVCAAGLPVDDLHQVILDNDYTKCLREDGCHMTDHGNAVLSDAVVRAVLQEP